MNIRENDKNKTKAQFISELEELRQQVTELERTNAEHTQAEETLRDAEQKWVSLTQNSDDHIIIADKNHIIRYINKTLPPDTPGEVIGTKIYEYMPKEYHDIARECSEKVFKTGKPDSYDVVIDRPGFGTKWFHTNVVPIKTDEGISSVILVCTDITEHKQAEEALQKAKDELELREKERTKELQESEKKFKILSEKSIVGIYIIQDNLFKYINPAFAQIFDYPADELIKKNFEEIVFPDDRTKIREKIDKLITGEIDYSYSQFRGVQKGGETRFLEVYKARIILENHPAIIGTLIDITQRKHIEKVLQEKSDQLENLNRELESNINTELEKRTRQDQILMQQSKLAAMGEMVGAIAHQWRQPLTTVGVILQNLKMAYKLNKLTELMLEKSSKDAMKQINYMSKTIDDFRNFFKPSKGKETFSVMKAVEDTISIMQSQLENNFIKIHFLCDKIMPFHAAGYPNEFKQVLVNVFNNAKTAILARRQKGLMEKASGDISIDISGANEKIILKIANNGGRIPKKIIHRIFEPYFTTWEDRKGTGLGLYMSKTIIESQMGGRIFIENAKHGPIFTIELIKGEEN